MAKTGSVFSVYGNGTEGLTTYYGYDDRSQLASEVTKVGTGSTVLTGRNDSSYTYDTIGNRSTVTHNGNTATYTTDAVNQYSQRTVPGYFDVAGSDSAGTVTVAKSGGPTDTATRHGNYFFDAYALTNTSVPTYASLTITGTGSATLPAYVEKTPQALTYDDDGNMTSDGHWNYTYDGENRPITAETTATAVTAGVTRQKLTLGYDYLGRRIVKGRESGWNGSAYAICDFWDRYLYNGWHVVAKVDGNDGALPIIANYFWGLDLSGTIGGAGGVGGLLMVQEGGETYLPAYDAMGNVHAMIKASDGSIAATYEYDAFGQTLRESGAYAASNPFRFSTKYTDIETGLVNHDTRYYSPSLGRFLNRDSIGEQGGLNLYAYVNNGVPNAWDMLGMVNILSHTLTDENDPAYNESAGGWSPGSVQSVTSGNVFYLSDGWKDGQAQAAANMAGGKFIGYDKRGNIMVQYDSTQAKYDGLGRLIPANQTDRLVGQGTYVGGDAMAPNSYHLGYFEVGLAPTDYSHVIYHDDSAIGISSNMTTDEVISEAWSGATNNLSFKGSIDVADVVGLSANGSTPIARPGGEASIDGIIGGGYAAYAGFEQSFPRPGAPPPNVSISFMGGVGGVLGFTLDYNVQRVWESTNDSNYAEQRIVAIPTGFRLFFGLGVGEIGKINPGANGNIIRVKVDKNGNKKNYKFGKPDEEL